MLGTLGPRLRGRRRWLALSGLLGLLGAAVFAGADSGDAAAEESPDFEALDDTSSAPGRRLSTSTQCRQALEAMLNNEHWNFMNNTYTRWCRIKAENEMARCCGIADFAAGRGEGCGVSKLSGAAVTTECYTECQHTDMIDLCNSHLGGKACTVDRKLFPDAPLKVAETICVPDDCNNDSDRDAFIAWFATLYANRLSGWHSNWDDAVLSCPSVAVMALVWTLLAIFIIVLSLPVLYILFVAPKERGVTLVSQAEMQAEADAQEAEFVQDLRGAAAGGDQLGQSGMSRTGMSRTR